MKVLGKIIKIISGWLRKKYSENFSQTKQIFKKQNFSYFGGKWLNLKLQSYKYAVQKESTQKENEIERQVVFEFECGH